MTRSPIQLSTLARENPWWADPLAIESDAQVRSVEAAPLAWRPPFPFDVQPPAVYTLRGPRQVGKTTLLKLLIRHLLVEGRLSPRSVLYLDCERTGIGDSVALADALRLYLAWSPDAVPLLIALDEVTRVRDWGAAIRGLVDAGALESAVVIATGSHALDIKRGGERMPGRRGQVEHLDYVLMPLSFRDYVTVRAPQMPVLPSLKSLDAPADVYAAAQEAAVQAPDLDSHFQRYLVTGGYLAALAREYAEGTIRPDLYLQFRDAFIGEAIRTGHREGYVREIVRWLWPRLGQEFSWRDLAGETEIGTHATARAYVEDIEELFLWHVFQRVKNLERPAPAFRSPKKLFAADPFAFHLLFAWGEGSLDPWRSSLAVLGRPDVAGRLVEGVVADHLRRAFGRTCYYYRTPGGQEIDFVAFGSGDRRAAAVEVKWRETVSRRDWQSLQDRGGGLLLTRSTLAVLDTEPATVGVPVHLFLAMFAGAPTLRPVRYTD